MLRVYIGFFILIFAALQACKSKFSQEPKFHYEYLPLEVGNYIIYDTDSTVYDKFNQQKRYYRFQIKEKVSETFKDNLGNTFYKIIRYKRKQDSLGQFLDSTFILKDVYAAGIVNQALEIVDDNQRYIKFIFPPSENSTWNAHSKNGLSPQEYFVEKIRSVYTLNGQSFDQVTKIVENQSNPEIKIFKKYFYSQYAKNIGVIERYWMDIASQKNLSQPIETRIEEGLIYHQKINTYGKE